MESLSDLSVLQKYYAVFVDWLQNTVFVIDTLLQAGVVLVALGLAALATPPLRRWLENVAGRSRIAGGIFRAVLPVMLPAAWLLLVWTAQLSATAAGWPAHLLKVVGSLITAWVVIRLASRMIRDRAWAKFVAVAAWTVAALNILNLLDPTIGVLDGLAVSFGDLRISALTVLKAILSLVVLLWLAFAGSRVLEQRFAASPNLTPSVQVLLAKLSKVAFIIIAVVVALNSVGIDLTAFAVFSGALGVGIGFGLQKIIANLVSGVILLLDKSVKPGDVIGVSGTYGWIESLGARYASVVTRDGTEHLIPNEELITQRVENWSHRDNLVRLKIPVGVSYKSDVRKAIALCLEAPTEVERVLKDPKPVCLMKGFGDSSVDLEIRIWIDDPYNGVSNVKSMVLLGVWDRFHQHGIEIPFPQRDLHLRSVFGHQDAEGAEHIERNWLAAR